jgi:hypothetical protein
MASCVRMTFLGASITLPGSRNAGAGHGGSRRVYAAGQFCAAGGGSGRPSRRSRLATARSTHTDDVTAAPWLAEAEPIAISMRPCRGLQRSCLAIRPLRTKDAPSKAECLPLACIRRQVCRRGRPGGPGAGSARRRDVFAYVPSLRSESKQRARQLGRCSATATALKRSATMAASLLPDVHRRADQVRSHRPSR